jgi:hypothetical protein
MTGGLMQIIAFGTQDMFLIGKPQITHWKIVHRRHTNFATESFEQVFNGTGDFGKKVVCQIQRNGDLISKMYLRVVLPALGDGYCWTSRVGHAMIKSAEFNVGGTTLDKHYGDWMNVWYEVARNFAQDAGYDKMIGNTPELTTPGAGTPSVTLYVPLYFSPCVNDGLAFPLIATQYHDSRVEIEFETLQNLICGVNAATAPSGVSMGSCSLYVDFVFLENEERMKFAQASHEYLIQQVQYANAESVTSQSSKFRLQFNHPCQAMYWNTRQNKYTDGKKFLAYNPSDWAACAELATKRAALAWCEAGTGATAADLSVVSGVTGALATALAAARPTLIDLSSANVASDAQGVALLGPALPIDLISRTVEDLTATFASAATRAASGDGAAAADVVVRQHDNYGVFLDKSVNPVGNALIQLNGQARVSKRDGMYYSVVQPWQTHSVAPCDGLNMYAFALHPEDHQPSGACNMSRIDNATLSIEYIQSVDVMTAAGVVATSVNVSNDAKCHIYVRNYNVSRIMGGMFGLAFSN